MNTIYRPIRTAGPRFVAAATDRPLDPPRNPEPAPQSAGRIRRLWSAAVGCRHLHCTHDRGQTSCDDCGQLL